MAAVIEFPTAASIWRQRNAARKVVEHRGGAKIIVFSGVRYSRPERLARKFTVAPKGKNGADG